MGRWSAEDRAHRRGGRARGLSLRAAGRPDSAQDRADRGARRDRPRHQPDGLVRRPQAGVGWADADAVVAGLRPREGVAYTALWLNEKGLLRALAHRDRLALSGSP